MTNNIIVEDTLALQRLARYFGVSARAIFDPPWAKNQVGFTFRIWEDPSFRASRSRFLYFEEPD